MVDSFNIYSVRPGYKSTTFTFCIPWQYFYGSSNDDIIERFLDNNINRSEYSYIYKKQIKPNFYKLILLNNSFDFLQKDSTYFSTTVFLEIKVGYQKNLSFINLLSYMVDFLFKK